LKPDLVLLDIQMPGCSGIDVVACLPRPRPAIVFCTAFDQYAVSAFELAAVDYLLKPVSQERLREAVERVRSRRPSESEAQIDRILKNIHRPPVHLLARTSDRYLVIPQSEVIYLSSEGGLTRLHTRERCLVLDPSLNQLETCLDDQTFFRVSRNAIVNLGAVAEVRPLIGRLGQAVLNNGVRLEVSRRRIKPLLEHLGGELARAKHSTP
jgi:two-component system LytT family response regulator